MGLPSWEMTAPSWYLLASAAPRGYWGLEPVTTWVIKNYLKEILKRKFSKLNCESKIKVMFLI